MEENRKHNLKVLVLIQALDEADPLMGFFVDWLKELSKHADKILACGLRVSDPAPAIAQNVEVMSLRPKGSGSRLRVIWTIFRISWSRRKDYTAVFVRGDAQYTALAGWFWRFLGKKVVLWYAHHVSNPYLKISAKFISVAVSSVPEAFPYRGIEPVLVGQSIDETKFTFPADKDFRNLKTAILGRVMPSKYILELLEAYGDAAGRYPLSLDLLGPSGDAEYAEKVRAALPRYPRTRWLEAGIPYDKVPETLRQYDILLNANVGSLDKCIVESMMSGVIPVAASGGYGRCLPDDLRWLNAKIREEVVSALEKLAGFSPAERRSLAGTLRKSAIEHHSLNGQVARIADLLR